MNKKKFKLLPKWQIGFGILGLITLLVLSKALMIKYDDWFEAHVNIILLLSAVFAVMFIITGAITVKQLKNSFGIK